MPGNHPLEHLSEERLEAMLLEATSAGVPGRRSMARVTAIRTVLGRRRAQRQAEQAQQAEADARQALELVNAVRGPDCQLTLAELHPVDVACVVADPDWAQLVASDEEIRRAIPTKPTTERESNEGR